MLKRIRKSLITRLMMYFLVAGLLFLILFGINFAHGLRVHFKQEILPNIAQYLGYIVEDIGTPPDLAKAQRLTAELSFELRITGPGMDWQSHPHIPPISELRLEPAPAPYQQYRISHRRQRNFVVLAVDDYQFMYVIGRPFRAERHQRSIGFILIVTISMLVLFWLIRRSLKPLQSVQQGIQRIGQGELDKPIKVQGSSELQALAEGINTMAEQIGTMLEGKQQMLLAISHELRSPITRARVNLELLPEHESRQALIDDCNEMEQLISQLLESERLNQRHATLNKTTFALHDLVTDTIAEYFPAAGIQILVNDIALTADRKRIGLLIKNLLSNALKYSAGVAEPVQIGAYQQPGQILLQVQDHGQGMPSHELDKVTRSFYRIDPARTRDTGGFGLGLYLCQKIVQAHGGDIGFASVLNQGTTVTVTIPSEGREIAQDRDNF